MPELVKLYIRHSLIGFGIAAVFVAMLLYFNVMNLWHLVSNTDVGVLAVLVLWISNGIVFAGVQFAWAVMNLADKDSGGGGTRSNVLVEEFRPVPVRTDETRADQRRRRR